MCVLLNICCKESVRKSLRHNLFVVPVSSVPHPGNQPHTPWRGPHGFHPLTAPRATAQSQPGGWLLLGLGRQKTAVPVPSGSQSGPSVPDHTRRYPQADPASPPGGTVALAGAQHSGQESPPPRHLPWFLRKQHIHVQARETRNCSGTCKGHSAGTGPQRLCLQWASSARPAGWLPSA